jgi:hypothetical protein
MCEAACKLGVLSTWVEEAWAEEGSVGQIGPENRVLLSNWVEEAWVEEGSVGWTSEKKCERNAKMKNIEKRGHKKIQHENCNS